MTRYQSQRDIWVVALLTASVVLGLGAAGLILANPMSMVLMVGFLVICLGGAGMSLLFLVRTYYDLGDGVLCVRHGLLSWRIPLDTIQKVSPARNYFSSAALSRDKLRIQFGKGYREIYISPRDRAGFLQELARLNPALHVQGGVVLIRLTGERRAQETRYPSKRNTWPGARLTALLLGFLMLGVNGCAYHPQPVSVFPEPSYLTISAPPKYPSPSSLDPMKRNENNFEMVHREPAEFSVQAQEENAFGFVRVKAMVGIDGNVLSARVTRGVHPLVDRAALEAAKRCTFRRLFPPENSTDYEATIFFQFGN